MAAHGEHPHARSTERLSQSLSLSLAYYAAMVAAHFTESGREHFRKVLAEAQNSASLSELPTATQQAAQILRSPICCTFP